jgi:hypothetical protein
MNLETKIDKEVKSHGGMLFLGVSSFEEEIVEEDAIQEEALSVFDNKKIPKIVKKRLALASYIMSNSDVDKITRIKLVKVFYLSDVTNNLELKAKYKREAAGLLDPVA